MIKINENSWISVMYIEQLSFSVENGVQLCTISFVNGDDQWSTSIDAHMVRGEMQLNEVNKDLFINPATVQSVRFLKNCLQGEALEIIFRSGRRYTYSADSRVAEFITNIFGITRS